MAKCGCYVGPASVGGLGLFSLSPEVCGRSVLRFVVFRSFGPGPTYEGMATSIPLVVQIVMSRVKVPHESAGASKAVMREGRYVDKLISGGTG